MSQSFFQRSAAFCLSAVVTMAMLSSVTELFQRNDLGAQMAAAQAQTSAQRTAQNVLHSQTRNAGA